MDAYFKHSMGMPDCVWSFVADFILPDCLGCCFSLVLQCFPISRQNLEIFTMFFANNDRGS